MGRGGFSDRSGAPGDVGHRPSGVTHPKSLLGPPQAGLSGALARRASPRDAGPSGKTRNDARAPLRPVKLTPISRDML